MSGHASNLTSGEIAYYAGFAPTSSIPIKLRSGDVFCATLYASPRYFIHKAVQPEHARRMVAVLQQRPENDSEVNSSFNPVFATVSTEGLGEPGQFRIDEQIDALIQGTDCGVATWNTIVAPLAHEADRVARRLTERKSIDDSGEASCYVVVRFFPGLRHPFPFMDFINLPEDNIDADIEAFLRNWAEEHPAQLAQAFENESERCKRREEKSRRRAVARPQQYDLIDMLQKEFSEDVGGAVDHLQPVKADGRSPLSLTLAVCDAINRLADLFCTFPAIFRQSDLGQTDEGQQPVQPDVVVDAFRFGSDGSGSCPSARNAVLDVVKELKLIDKPPERVSADRADRLVEQTEEDLSALLRLSAYLRRLLRLLNRADVEYDRGEGDANALGEPVPPRPESATPVTEALHAAVNHVALWYKECVSTEVPKQRQEIVAAFRHPARDSGCWPDHHVNKAAQELEKLMPGAEAEFIATVDDFYNRACSERYNIDRQFARPLLKQLRGLLDEFHTMIVAGGTSSPEIDQTGDAADKGEDAINEAEYDRLRELKKKIDPGNTYIGESIAILRVFEQIELYNRSTLSASPVLILGPTGAGKTMIAQLIHKHSSRKGELLRVQSNALKTNEEGIILEFWTGHGEDSTLKGIPNGGRPGVLQEHEGGTIFIDEAADLSNYMQGLLLDIIEQQPIRVASGVGSDVVPSVRLLIATNVDLETSVAKGEFRHDLLARICGQTLVIPPLSERKEDIPLLVQKWCKDEGDQNRVSNDFYLSLLRHDWTGNIRGLRQQVLQAIARAEGKALSAEHLSLETAKDVMKMRGATVTGELYDILKRKLEAKGFYKGKGGDLHKEIAGILGCSAGKVSNMAKASIGERG